MNDDQDVSLLRTDGASLVETREDVTATERAIVVNGRRCSVASSDVSFEQIVRLASADREPSHSRSLSVTYHRGPASATEGLLAPHQRTPIADGETFVVTRTDKS